MQNVLNDILSITSNVDITGNIFICDELCNLSFNYKEAKNMIINNKSLVLEIEYPNTDSSINYNGGDEFGSKQVKYTLKKIVFIGPAKHFIKSARRPNGMELILIHESDDGKRFQNVSVLLYGMDSCANQKTIQYKLFNEIADNIPTKAVGTKQLEINPWSVNDFLPDDRSFYTYNSTTNTAINWIVFKEEVCVPSAFIDKYFKYVLNPDKKGNILINAPLPINSTNLVLFGHQVVKYIPKTCAIKIAKSAQEQEKKKDAIITEKINTSKTEPKSEPKPEIESKKETETETEQKPETNEESKKETTETTETKKETDTTSSTTIWTVIKWILISSIIFITIIGIIIFVIWYWYYDTYVFIKDYIYSFLTTNIPQIYDSIKTNTNNLLNIVFPPSSDSPTTPPIPMQSLASQPVSQQTTGSITSQQQPPTTGIESITSQSVVSPTATSNAASENIEKAKILAEKNMELTRLQKANSKRSKLNSK